MPGTRKVNKKAQAKKDQALAQHVPQFINSNIASLEAAADNLATVYQAYNDEYYDEYGLSAAKKVTEKAFALVEKAIEMSKKNKFYDEAAGPWTGRF